MSETEERQGVLLLESEVLARHALAEYLRDCGYAVAEAATTDEALLLVREAALPFVVVLADVNAGGSINSFDLACRIRAGWPHIPVVLAGSIERAAQAAGEICDERPEIGRPYDPAAVVDRIRQLLAARARNGGIGDG
jgi:CheY-like chemotaxis protein